MEYNMEPGGEKSAASCVCPWLSRQFTIPFPSLPPMLTKIAGSFEGLRQCFQPTPGPNQQLQCPKTAASPHHTVHGTAHRTAQHNTTPHDTHPSLGFHSSVTSYQVHFLTARLIVTDNQLHVRQSERQSKLTTSRVWISNCW